MMLVDTHSHLDYIVRNGETPQRVLQDARENGVAWLLNPSVHPAQFDEIVGLCDQHEGVYAAAAVHPTDVQDVPQDTWLQDVTRMLEHPKVIAIGETGLDYYHDTTHVDLQKHCFNTLLHLGRERNLPVIVHDREAHADVYNSVQQVPGVRGVMHCFSGDTDFARQMIDLGFYISFAGNITFKNATTLHEAAREIPLEWILLETDAPFLSPVPFRGKPNEPARVRYVAEKIAELKGINVEEVARITTKNAHHVFGVPLPC